MSVLPTIRKKNSSRGRTRARSPSRRNSSRSPASIRLNSFDIFLPYRIVRPSVNSIYQLSQIRTRRDNLLHVFERRREPATDRPPSGRIVTGRDDLRRGRKRPALTPYSGVRCRHHETLRAGEWERERGGRSVVGYYTPFPPPGGHRF